MKKRKRLIALFLSFTLALSVFPVLATDGEGASVTVDAEPVIVTYNFELEKTSLVNTSGSSFAGKFLDGTANQGAVASYYNDGSLDWKYTANNADAFKSDTVSSSAMIYFGGTDSYKWSGLRMGVKTTENGASKYPVGHWTAMTIRVPQTGRYNLTLNHQKRNDGAVAGEIYLLEGAFTDWTSIDSALTAEKLQATVDFSKNNNVFEDAQADLGEANLRGGEYTLVFKAVQDKTGGYGSYFYLRSLVAELVWQPSAETPTDAVYNFTRDYVNTLTGQTYTSTFPAALSSYYNSGVLNWKAAANSTSLHPDTYSSVSNYMGFGSGSNWAGLRLAQYGTLADGSGNRYLTDYWYAFTLRAPGAGTFDAALKYQTRSDANQAVNVYLLEGALTDPAAIAQAMADTQPLRDAFDSRKNTAGVISTSGNRYSDGVQALGQVTLTDSDYTLVVQATGTAGTYFFLNEFSLQYQLPEPETTTTEATTSAPTTIPEETTTAPEETTPPEEDPASAGYSFELKDSQLKTTAGNNMGGGTLTSAAIKDALADYYDRGLISWKYAADNIASFQSDTVTASNTFFFGGSSSYKWDGLRLGMMLNSNGNKTYPAGYWAAFTIQSPGADSFEISLDYQSRHDGSTMAEIYLIKGALTDPAAIEEKMTAENLLKVMDFSGGSNFADASVVLGLVEMLDSEYTLVFKACNPTGGAYMHINELVFTRKDPADVPPPEVIDPAGYSFELKDSDLKTTGNGNLGGKNLLSATVKDALDAYYQQNLISWKFALDNISTFTTATTTASNTYYLGGGSYKWDGLRLGMMLSYEGGSSYPGGYWTALTIQSPGADTFALTLDYQTRHDGSKSAEIYLMKGTFTDIAAVEAKMTKDNLLKKMDFSGGSNFADASKVLGVVTMEDCEYTLVFKAGDAASGAYMHINGLSFEKTAPKQELGPVQETKVEYLFDLQSADLTATDGSSLAGATLDTAKVKEALEEYFADQKLYWKYAADNLASFKKDGNTVASTFFFGAGTSYKWTGLRMGVKTTGPETDPETGKKVAAYPEGWWLATTIHAPGNGLYYLTLDYQMRSDATTGGEIYLIKGELTDPAQIEAQMTESNLLTVLNCKSKRTDMVDKQADLGAVAFEQGAYTLVFKGAKNSGNASAYLYINKLTATHESIAPPPAPKETVYNFDLANRDEGIYTGAPMLKDKMDDIAQRYAQGEMNWKYHDKAANLGEGSHAFNPIYGMVMYTGKDNWMAFKIKSPGEGLQTIILNHARSGNGALGAVYILPADTQDISAAMDHSNRVGKLEYYNETGDPNVQNGFTTILGTWEFGAEEEYILVFEAYSSTIYKRDLGYMWISQVIIREGDHTPVDTGSKRQVKSTVVNAEPCRTMETTAYMTTAEINGQDLFFMPVEGRKMFIFNLEDMTRERIVQTPFGISRGITSDKDGIIWMVGDSSVLWRYDPYTNTSTTSRNYKLSDGIDGATSGFSIICGDDGNIYFGTGWTSYIVRYNPAADKFSKVAGTINPDASYSCGLIMKDGYLYAGLSGDRISDGNYCAEIVKIDLATDTVVGRTDIREQFGPDEVMVRGTGIGGDTLFAGGNSMKSFIAIDINTMELKDYGIHRPINLATTEEIDGKLYLVVSGMGIYCYESATDTLTKIPDMDTATMGFRCGERSSVTLSNNPLFPGISYVTQNSTGLKIYNIETKQVYTPPLYDKDVDGSGQIIRTIVRGEDGDSKIYLGGYNTVTCAFFDTETGEITTYKTTGQTDSILWYEGAMYVGNYNAGNVVRINFDDEDRNVILLSAKNLYHQARVHALAAGDGMLFAGTIPDWNLFGGLLAIIDLETLDRHVEENLIDSQSITSLAYGQGIVMGGTSISGGTGATRPAGDTTSAVIFAYDAKEKELLAQLDLREVFPELPDILPYIDGIVADPNVEENGRFWGMVSETLFSFTFNKETRQFTVKEELSFGKTNMPSNIGRHWDACDFDFDDEGYMYAVFHTIGGVQKINLNDTSEHYRINCEIPRTFNLGPDGNLYYSLNHSELKMYPLNVTEEDWAVTEALDKKIRAIGSVTLDSEEAITAIRTEYDALSLKHQALIQNYDLLLMAETDLLECKIDSIGEITLEKETLILSLMAQYDALPTKEQGYVKNFQTLNAAHLAVRDLINAREAARVQKLLDDGLRSLGEITLEDEEGVKALRAEYDSLIFLQRQLVDASGLLAAESTIKELRQVRINRLIALIAGLGEVTLADEPVINEAMEIYNWLYMDERSLVDYTTLITAQSSLRKLQKAAAAEVDALISAIGDTVSYDSGDAIGAAREAYDALTEGSKKYVKMLSYLEQAELLYSQLFPLWAIVALGAAGVAVITLGVIVFLHKKKKAVTQ